MYENIVKVNMIREKMKIMGDTFQLYANIFLLKFFIMDADLFK